MQIQRYRAGGRSVKAPDIGCGCAVIGAGVLVAIVIAGLLLLPLLPQITARLSGFESIGTTDDVLQANQTQPLPTRIPAQQSAPPASVNINAGSYGAVTLDNAADIVIGSDNGAPVAQVSLTENDLLDLCVQYSSFCTPAGAPVRNMRFDLRDGGMIVQGEFNVPQLGIWQAAGVVMQVSGSDQLTVVGVEIDGQVFAAPPNEIGATIDEVERTANDILRQASANISGQSYDLREIFIDAQQLLIVLR